MCQCRTSSVKSLKISTAIFDGNLRLIVALLFCALLSGLTLPSRVYAQAVWVSFDPQLPAETGSRSYIKEEATSGILLNFDIPGMYVTKVEVEGQTYHRLSVPGRSVYVDVGRPELPVIGQLVEIPFGVQVTPRIFSSEYITLDDYNVFPAQKPAIRSSRGEVEFALDRSAYDEDTFYPDRLAEIRPQDIGVIRGHRVAFVRIHPLQYNPSTKEIRAHSKVEIRLEYDRPGQIERVHRRIQSRPFEELLSNSVLNYKSVERLRGRDSLGFQAGLLHLDGLAARGSDSEDRERQSSKGCDYLIITPGNFYNANDPGNPVVRLRNWKRHKGLVTEVVTLADLPDSNNDGTIDEVDIGAYIDDIYANWAPPPTYILLFGDTGDNAGTVILPTNHVTPHPHNNYENPAMPGQQAEIGTDLYYVDVDGNDVFPDIFIGRLSVDTVAQATDVVDKIIDYERTPPVNPAFYDNSPLVALFEDSNNWVGNDAQEDPTFRIIEFADSIQAFLTGTGYTAAEIYDDDGAPMAPPQPGPRWYENGSNLPNQLTINGGFGWAGATADIANAINNGSFLVTYDGHGGRERWVRPSFDAGDIAALANLDLTPVVLSLACETGWFDNERDRNWLNSPDNSESFAESFLRRANNGAVGVIAASRVSWDPNDFMMLGMFEAIWPDFAPNPPFGPGQLPDVQSGPLRRLGQIDVFSKVYMATYYASTGNLGSLEFMTFELYHVLGDPEMPVWTQVPQTFVVDHPAKIGGTGVQDFVARITDGAGQPVRGAVVSLVQDDELLAVGYADAEGVARFTGGFTAGRIDLTVTGQNFRPYEGSIEVTVGGADLNRLDPQDGPEGQALNVGGRNFTGNEQVDIYLDNQWKRTHQASGGQFGQSGVEDVPITVPVGHPHGLFNLRAEGQGSGKHAVDVFHVRDANPIDLYTYSQWDNTTWHLHAGDNPTWNNPEIQLYDANNNAVQSNNLVVGRQYQIRARIHNGTAFAANNATVFFRWANFGAGQRVWHDIDTAVINVPASGTTDAQVSWVPGVTGHLCLKVEISHLEDVTPSNNSGQENTHVGPTSSPATVSMKVWNPAQEPAAVFFEVRQLKGGNGQKEEPLWWSRIQHPDPQVLPPEGEAEAEIIVEPELEYAGDSTPAEFSLTAFVDGKIIGGVNIVAEPRPQRWLASAHLGLAIPSGTFNNYLDSGPSVMFDFGYTLNQRFSIIGLLGYNRFSFSENTEAMIDNTHWINLNVTAQYEAKLGRRISGYVRGGPGYYIPKSGDSKVGVTAGLGLGYLLTRHLSLKAGIDYHLVREGMRVYNLRTPDAKDNVRFAVPHIGLVYKW